MTVKVRVESAALHIDLDLVLKQELTESENGRQLTSAFELASATSAV